MNRMKRKYYNNLELPQRGLGEILTILEKRLVVHLVTIGGLKMAVETTKVLRIDMEIEFCDNTL
jgi:hypothetical protein